MRLDLDHAGPVDLDLEGLLGRLDVMQDDLVKLTVESADVAYSFTIDEYRLSRRIPAGGMFAGVT